MDKTKYWLEFAVPNPEQDYNPESAPSERENPENYNVVIEDDFYALGEHNAAKRAKEMIRQDKRYTLDHGVVMFTELENVKDDFHQIIGFTDEDWRARLKRENPPPDSVVRIDLDDL